MISTILIQTKRQGLYEFTNKAQQIVVNSNLTEGLATFYVQHTSASLLIQENADRAVINDLQNWFNRLAPEGDNLYTHTSEGADDMPAHIKSALTQTSISIPIINGKLALGVWQGIFLFEHRTRNHSRKIIVHIL